MMSLKKNLLLLFLSLALFLMPLFSVVSADTGYVQTPYSFSNGSDTYTGNATQYFNDDLYNYFYDYFNSLSTPFMNTSLYIFNYSGNQASFSNVWTSWLRYVGDDMWYYYQDYYIDEDVLLSLGNNGVSYVRSLQDIDINRHTAFLSAPFVAFSEPSNTSFGVSYPLTSSSTLDYRLFTASSVNSTYSYIMPFNSIWEFRSSYFIQYRFSIYPSAVFTSEGIDFSKLLTYTYSNTEYVFIPYIYITGGNSGSVVVYYDRITLSGLQNYINSVSASGFYGSSFEKNSSSSGGESIDYSDRLDTIIQNQETHTSLLNTIIDKLNKLILGQHDQTELLEDISKQKTEINNTNNLVVDVDGIEDGFKTDFNNNFDSVSESLDDFNEEINNSSGITFLSSTIQSFYESSGDFKIAFVIPVVIGVCGLFLGV